MAKNKFTRREFVKRTAVAGAGVALMTKFAVPRASAINNSMPLAKFGPGQVLRGLNYPAGHILGALSYPNDPNGIPVAGGIADPVFGSTTTMYQIGVQEFTDVLHPSLPNGTKLWGYYDKGRPIPRHLGGLIVTTRGQAARLRVTNELPSRHLLPVDIGLPGAAYAQNRIAVHLHGGLVPWISDGGPFDWFSSSCPTYQTGLSFMNGPGSVFDNIAVGNLTFPLGLPIQPGQADYFYPNNQSTRLMWYHDHAFGLTRLNAYAGIATGYLVVDLANDAARLTANVPPYASMIPLVWQDKKFVNANTALTDLTWTDIARPDTLAFGSLWYEHTYNPKLWTLKPGLPVPDPSIIAEYFGDTMLCNGTVYPKLTVDPKAYRFMVLNACNARFLNINTFVADATADGITLNKQTMFPANLAGPRIFQIGNEAGYLAQDVVFTTSALTQFNPATLTGNLILAPAERADVVMDFSAFAGQDIILYSDSPAPFPGGVPINDYYPGAPGNPIVTAPGFGPDTRQILRIHVNAATPAPANNGPFLNPLVTAIDPPALVTLPALASPVANGTVIPPLTAPPGLTPRTLTLNETFDKYGRLIQMLGTTVVQVGGTFGQPLLNPPTEVINSGAMEVWQVFNTTADTHPIHFHLVNLQVLSRQSFTMSNGVFVLNQAKTLRGPEVNELGWKETVRMNPGECTTVLARFDLPTLAGGLPLPFTVPSSARVQGSVPAGKTAHEYVWHCHILEHEEHDMMRPMVVSA